MKKFSDYLLAFKANVLKSNFPEKAVKDYCLKTNPNAWMFLPGREPELAVIDAISPINVQEFVSKRVWSTETRHVLFERGLWNQFEVENLWEFEFLLTSTPLSHYPSGCLRSVAPNRLQKSSQAQILAAMAKNDLYAVAMGSQYPNAISVIGLDVLAKKLPARTFEVLADTVLEKHPEQAAAFGEWLQPSSSSFYRLFIAMWQQKGDMMPLMPSLYNERKDLYQMLKEQSQIRPEKKVLSTVFQYLEDRLKADSLNSEAEKEFKDWLPALELYVQQKNADSDFLFDVYRRLRGLACSYPELTEELKRIVQTYAPKFLNQMKRMADAGSETKEMVKTVEGNA